MPTDAAATSPMFRIISESATQKAISYSHVDYAAIGVQHAFVHHFRQGGVRKHRIDEFRLGRLAIHGYDKALDQLGDFGPNHMGAEKFSGFGVKNGFYESLRLAERDRLAIADEGKAADPGFNTQLFGFCLGEAEGRDLRIAIGATRNHRLVQRMWVESFDRLDANHAFMFGLMREHGRAGDIPDRINPRHIGAPHSVRNNTSPLNLHAERLKPKVLGIAGNAGRGNHAFGFQGPRRALAVFDCGNDAIRHSLHLRHLGRGQYFYALLFEAFAGMRGDLHILGGNNLRQYFNDRHLRAHATIERSEFDPDRARTYHDEGFGKFSGNHGLEVGPDKFSVRLDARYDARPRAGRDNDILGQISARAQHTFWDGVWRLHRRLF